MGILIDKLLEKLPQKSGDAVLTYSEILAALSASLAELEHDNAELLKKERDQQMLWLQKFGRDLQGNINHYLVEQERFHVQADTLLQNKTASNSVAAFLGIGNLGLIVFLFSLDAVYDTLYGKGLINFHDHWIFVTTTVITFNLLAAVFTRFYFPLKTDTLEQELDNSTTNNLIEGSINNFAQDFTQILTSCFTAKTEEPQQLGSALKTCLVNYHCSEGALREATATQLEMDSTALKTALAPKSP